MKNYTYKFSVEKPCAESWLNMTPTEKGNFCLNCQKEVINFSSLSDNEIIKVIENAKGRVCGRFRSSQLNRPMQLNYYAVQRPFPVKTILAGIVALTLLQSAPAEASVKPVKQQVSVFENSGYENIPDQNNPADSVIILRGRLLTVYDSLPVTHATIHLQNSDKPITVDSTGRFMIFIPENHTADFTFEVVAMGYEKSYFTVSIKTITHDEQVFFISNVEYITDGIVIMERVDEKPNKKKRKR